MQQQQQRRRYSNYTLLTVLLCVLLYSVVTCFLFPPSFLPLLFTHFSSGSISCLLLLSKKVCVCIYTGARGGWGDTFKHFQKCQSQGHSSVTCLRGPSTDVSRHLSLSPKSNFRHSFFFSFFTCEHSIHPISHHPSVFFFSKSQPMSRSFLLLVKKKKKKSILAVIIFVSLTNKQEKRIKKTTASTSSSSSSTCRTVGQSEVSGNG